MRSELLFGCLLVAGCFRPDGGTLDALLTTSRIDRIEVVDDERSHTNVFAGREVARLLGRLGATNRIADALSSWQKSYVSGDIVLYGESKRLGSLAYFPREQVLSYRGYEFKLKDTNDLPALFQ